MPAEVVAIRRRLQNNRIVLNLKNRKEGPSGCCKIIIYHLSGGTEKNYENTVT